MNLDYHTSARRVQVSVRRPCALRMRLHHPPFVGIPGCHSFRLTYAVILRLVRGQHALVGLERVSVHV